MKTLNLVSLGILGLFTTLNTFAASTLLIGDSHSVGVFGQTLDAKLRTLPDMKVHTEASCGSIIRWWYTGHPTPCGYLGIDQEGKKTESTKAPTPLIRELIKSNQPDLIIMEMGANYMTGYPEATLTNDVEQVLNEIESSHAKCLWVSPPASRKYREERKSLVVKLEKLIHGRCQWFDSIEVTHYPETGGDGVHYGTPALAPIAREWANEVFKVIQSLE